MTEALIKGVGGKEPRIDPTAFTAPTSVVLGEVTLGARASVWYHTVLRADCGPIEIGEDSNVQDNCTVHVDPGFPVSIGLLRERLGTETARAVSSAMVDTVDEIERVIAEEAIDAQWARGGVLRLARGERQRASIEGAYQTLDALGLAGRYELLEAAQIADRIVVLRDGRKIAEH